MAKKYESDLDELASGIREIHLPVTVLSWNINGQGTADCKQRMTDSVVKKGKINKPYRIALQCCN